VSEIVELDGIGPVVLTTPKKGKRLTIKVRPFKGVEVFIPLGTPPSHVAAFIKQNRDWIKKAVEKTKAKEGEQTIFDENTGFQSHTFALVIQPDTRHDVNIKLANGTLLVKYPSHMNVRTASIQSAIRGGIEDAIRIEAKKFLPGRLHELAKLHQFEYKKLFIKNLKTRWGSCSAINNINLNLHLLRLPFHLIDYVILHELCHTVEKNHGPQFWKLLDKVADGKAKQFEKEMKQYRTVIY
jgi:predicted metal-dependent hydrolase